MNFIHTKAYSRLLFSNGVKIRPSILVQHAAVRLVQTHPHGFLLTVPICPTDTSSVAGTFIGTLRILILLSDVREVITAATPTISKAKVPCPYTKAVVIAPRIDSHFVQLL